MPSIASLTLKATPAGTEEIPVNDAGNDRKVTVGAIQQPAASHIANVSNPHNVTKAQVGLGNVDNTSDANKPVSIAQAAALAPKGLLSGSGLTLPGTGLGGRQSAGTGAMQLITIGSGLDLTGGVLTAPPGLNLVNERFTEVNTTTTDDDYLVVLQGTTSRTITLKTDSPVGKIVVVRNDCGAVAAIATVSAPVGGNFSVPYRSSAMFFKATTGWLPIAERRFDAVWDQDDTVEDNTTLPPYTSQMQFTLTSGFELTLSTPSTRSPEPVTLHNVAGSTVALYVAGHINGSSSDFLVFPGETVTLLPTSTTWRILSGPITPRYSRLTSNVVANGTANTLVEATELGFAVIPGTYRFKFVIPYTAAVATTGSRWTVNGPTASMLSYWSRYPLTASTETFNHGLTTYRAPASSNATSIVAGNIAVVEGIATFSAAGTLVVEFANEVSSSAITALAGATGELVRVG